MLSLGLIDVIMCLFVQGGGKISLHRKILRLCSRSQHLQPLKHLHYCEQECAVVEFVSVAVGVPSTVASGVSYLLEAGKSMHRQKKMAHVSSMSD